MTKQVFDQATQEKIQDAIMADQRAGLEKNNIPVNQATLYMAHYVGPAGASRVINSASSNPNQAVVDAIIDPKYKSNPTAYENERNKILLRNPELGKLTTGQFQNVWNTRGTYREWTQDWTTGLGFIFKKMHVDYALCGIGSSGIGLKSHIFSLTYNWNSPKP